MRALAFRRALVAEARLVWGLDAPVAVLAGQVHQESGWRPDARSPYAGGLSQFTPATAADISAKYPDLGPARPFEPAWALRALAYYDRDLWTLQSRALPECDRLAFMLSAYNGGQGNVLKQQRAARAAGDNDTAWFYHTELYRVRAAAAHDENTNYVSRIMWRLQYLYSTWGRGAKCVG